jgi:hypothetical protein
MAFLPLLVRQATMTFACNNTTRISKQCTSKKAIRKLAVLVKDVPICSGNPEDKKIA